MTSRLAEPQPAAEPAGQDAGAYRAHLLAAGLALHQAARTEDQFRLVDLDLVLTGRRAVLDLLTAVHSELTGFHPTLRSIHPHDIEAHPVEALGRALLRCPRPPGRLSPTDVALATAVSAPGAAWQRAARHATIAHHAWVTGARDPLDPHQQWAGIADLATMADVLAQLDVGLVVATAVDAQHRALTDTLRTGLNTGMGLIAREALRVAARGPLPDVGPDRAPRPPLQVMPVREARQLPQAQQRLAALLDHGGQLRPERFPSLAAQHAKACLMLADAVAPQHPETGRSGRPLKPAGSTIDTRALEAALRRHARALSGATTRRNSIASLVTGDGRPLRQAAEIDRVLQRDLTIVTDDDELLRDVVRQLAVSTQALSNAATRALESGAWMVPSFETSMTEPLWCVWRAPAPVPSPVTAIRQAALTGRELAQRVTPPAPAPPDLGPLDPRTGRLRLPDPQRLRTATDVIRLATTRPRLPAYPVQPSLAHRR